MNKLTIIDQIQKSPDLLSMPQAISEILHEMEKQDFSADKLGRIILKDASLTGRILRLANSPFYQRGQEIKSVNQAIQVLGSNTVKCLALSSSVFNSSQLESTTGVDMKAFFSSVLTVAAGAEQVARLVDFRSSDEAFIAGLLHHIGIMFFLHHYPDQYRRIIAQETSARTLVDAEVEVFGVDHAEVGFILARRWHLPDYVCASIRAHHQTSVADSPDPLHNILRLATLMTDDSVAAYPADREARISLITEVSESLELSKEQVDSVTASLLAETLKIAEYLDVDIGNIEEMLTRANQEIWKTYLTVENLFRERQELSAKLLKEERDKGAVESKNIAIATLSHYLNNATMAISGRAQIMRRQVENGRSEELMQKLPGALDVVERSIQKIRAVLLEIRDISPIDEVKFYDMSNALNLDERINRRMEEMKKDSGLVLPQEITDYTTS